jgi:putative transcriptional regulator
VGDARAKQMRRSTDCENQTKHRQRDTERLKELPRGEHGRVTAIPNVAQIREATGLSQARFAQLIGVSPRTLQDWEQGRRAPSGAARTLLLVAALDPMALLTVA